jgi:hypothetical protein
LASLKYRLYGVDEKSLEWIVKKRYTLPLLVVRLLLFIPEAVLHYFLKDSQDYIEGITPKQFIRVIYEMLNEIAKFKDVHQNQIIYENRKEKLKHIILVE